MIMDLLKNDGVFIVWAVLLLAALLVIFRYMARRVETRPAALALGTLIFVISVGQFAFFYFYYVPKIRVEMHREVEILIESMSIIELDNVKQNDLVHAYQRENEALNLTVRNLRAGDDAPEEQAAGRVSGQGVPVKPPDKAPVAPAVTVQKVPLPPAAEKKFEKEGAHPVQAKEETPPPRKGKRYRPLRENTDYNITILTPEDNREFAKHLKEAFKWLWFDVKEPLLEDVSENRLVFHSESDRSKADYIVAFLHFTYKFSATPELFPDPLRQGIFLLYLTPESGRYWETKSR
jgi:hypothetical protein